MELYGACGQPQKKKKTKHSASDGKLARIDDALDAVVVVVGCRLLAVVSNLFTSQSALSWVGYGGFCFFFSLDLLPCQQTHAVRGVRVFVPNFFGGNNLSIFLGSSNLGHAGDTGVGRGSGLKLNRKFSWINDRAWPRGQQPPAPTGLEWVSYFFLPSRPHWVFVWFCVAGEWGVEWKVWESHLV